MTAMFELDDPQWQAELCSAGLGPARRWRPVRGGDICDAHEVELSDGRRCFLKSLVHSENVGDAEAEGLARLRSTNTVCVPQVWASGHVGERAYLALEWLDFAPASTQRVDRADEVLGRQLAQLHQSRQTEFGGPEDNFLGPLPQRNRPRAAGESLAWHEFYRIHRLEPLLQRCRSQGNVSATMSRNFERLYAVLDQRVGPVEAPALLHGDLWSGNHAHTREGRAYLFDPAVYAGHREIDLAMMHLFGGFSPRVLSAYEEVAPLAEGWVQRRPLYQLYPLLVHLALFGGGYAAQVERALRSQL